MAIHRSKVASVPCVVSKTSSLYLDDIEWSLNQLSHSTDFEVHRNWLAITHTLPISRWYYDVRVWRENIYNLFFDGCCRRHLSGVHTYSAFFTFSMAKFTLIALDYPPFFAYFEKLLSIPAFFIDSRIVDLSNLNYDAWSVIAYQRTTVIVTELVLGIVLLQWVQASTFSCHFIVSWQRPPRIVLYEDQLNRHCNE